MAVPTLLSDALYSHANEIIDRIKEKEIKKKDLKLSKKNGASSETMNEVTNLDYAYPIYIYNLEGSNSFEFTLVEITFPTHWIVYILRQHFCIKF